MAFPKIVFDVDNVLADSMNIFCQKVSKHLGMTITKNEIKHHKIVGSVPLSPQLIFKLQSEMWTKWNDIPPTESDLPRKIAALQGIGFKIYVATTMPSRLGIYAERWLRYQEIPYSKFYACGPKYSKSSIEADALVDDASEEIRQFVRHGRTGFLYQQPWNCTARIAKAVIVKNLDEVLAYYGLKRKSGIYRDVRWQKG